MKPWREQSFVSQISCAFACMVASGWGKVPFSHLEKPSQSVLTLRRKLHSSQLDLVRSRRRSGGQVVSDMKRSEIVISPEGGLVFELPEVVFEPEEGAPLGALACWVEPPAGPEGAAVPCEMEPAGAGVKPTLEDIESERGGRGAKEARAEEADTPSGQGETRVQRATRRG